MPLPRSRRPARCEKCGSTHLYWHGLDEEWACFCGWRTIPAELLPYVKQRPRPLDGEPAAEPEDLSA